jgi:uncharacterized protein (DUF2267 family)
VDQEARDERDLPRGTPAQYERFITTIAERAGLSWEGAERAARATLSTLAERLSQGRARDIAALLPVEVRDWLATDEPAEGFAVDELLRRVAEREGVDDLETAERHVRAVLTAVARELTPEELEHLMAELPKDVRRLLEDRAGARPPVLAVEDFIRRVADRAATDEETARLAAEVVLETLGERLAGGEVEDLAAQLPVELRPALARGNARSRGKAVRLSLDEFAAYVAEREGVRLEQALDHVGAVLRTVRDAVSDDELADLVEQLPAAYVDLLSRH